MVDANRAEERYFDTTSSSIVHLLLEQRRRERQRQGSSVSSVASVSDILSIISLSPKRAAMSSSSDDQSGSSSTSTIHLEELLAKNSFHWRRDPLTSQSDWILEVRVIQDLSASDNNGYADDLSLATCSDDDCSLFPVELYHIHKAVMVQASDVDRRSKYFAQVFASSPTSSCELCLPPLAASAIPVWLDCMYGTTEPIAITTQNATALFYLGGYFQIPDLQRKAMEFCLKDLRLGNAHLYYKHAKRLDEPDIIQAVARLVGSKVRAINWSVPLVDECRATFWKSVLPFCACSRRASLFVGIACARDHCEKQLEAQLFRQLTRKKWMREIDARVACTFLRIEADLLKPSLAKALTDGRAEASTSDLTCLQRRCFASLARDWSNITPETLQFLTKNIPAKLLDLLMKELDLVSDGVSVTLTKDNWTAQSVMSSTIDDMNLMLLGEGKYAI